MISDIQSIPCFTQIEVAEASGQVHLEPLIVAFHHEKEI